MKADKTDFAHKVSALRRSLRPKVSQAKFAEALGIESTVTISRWERGKNVPDLKTIAKIAEYFGKPISYFVDHSVEAPQKDSGSTVSDLLRIVERQQSEIDNLKKRNLNVTAMTGPMTREEQALLTQFRELPPRGIRRAFVFYALTLNEEFLSRILDAVKASNKAREGLRTELVSVVNKLLPKRE